MSNSENAAPNQIMLKAGHADLAALIGRVLICVLFFISGVWKLQSADGTIGYIASVGLPLPQLGYVIALVVELGVATALLVGFKPRTMAFIMAVFCIATAVFFHHNFGDQNQMVHFLKNLTMTGGLLQIVAFGAGRYAVSKS